MDIRKYKKKDFENYRKICIETAPNGLSLNEKKQKILTLTYCEYYAECEGDVCFSLTDENDNAVGYILCAADNEKYAKAFTKYACKIARLSPSSAVSSYFGARIYKPFNNEYPSHLHIDILPDYQHLGYGTELMNALKNELKVRNIGGVILCVGSGNENAIKFYKKNGFTVVKNLPGGILMGCKL